ncbi:hypothetical protein PALI_a1252 [Pseudoalteromonas aliena SW19]|uniref:Uncharacterized protein n=1 Tax=Pseudoalteromonas aliena SW19 TaxID=1314866 RepID=A0ABR9E032_9GAMM|nr:hypothetical protein [Pseudoalteromonas aliena SW19]
MCEDVVSVKNNSGSWIYFYKKEFELFLFSTAPRNVNQKSLYCV